METQPPSSSSHPPRWTHDVFLSFRGEDTRKNFTDHLHRALLNAGIHAFRGDKEIHEGEQIPSELERGIRESRISVIVFSKDYATSGWSLYELVEILKRKNSDDSYRVLPIFYDVRPAEVGNPKGRFKEAFDEYEKNGEQSKAKKIVEWRKALKDVSKLAGIVLQDESNGHEAVFIQTIVREVVIMLKQGALSVPSYTVGLQSRVKDIDLWLKESADVRVGVISGMRGIGKTTVTKVAYNLNFTDFEASSFLANIREASVQQNGLVRLQSQLLSDISKGGKQKIRNICEGIVKIQDAVCGKRILVVLDDVDQIEQVNALVGGGDLFPKGSRIIITTPHKRLLGHQTHKSFCIKQLDYNESLHLFSMHAFSQEIPVDGYLELSERVVQHCEGLPLALQVMGSSLYGKSTEFWATALEKLQAVPDKQIRKTLEMSYKSLHDDHDKRLFLVIASSYVGEDIDDAVKMLEENDFYSKVGMQDLINRSLVSVDKDNRLVMHHLVRDMATSIIHQETVDGPGELDFFASTGAKTETITSEGSLLSSNDKCGKRKRTEDYEDESKPQFKQRSSLFKRLCVGFFALFEPATRLTKLLTGHRC